MADLTPHDIGWFESVDELRAWLDAHHATAPEKWVGTRPKATGLPSVTWEEIVDEVLCVGWIDGIRKKVDGGSAQRITPRRPGSVWSARNVGRVLALRDGGPDATRRRGGVRAAARRPDRDLLVRRQLGARRGGRGGAPCERCLLGVLGGAAARLPAIGDDVGHEREATGDP